jgi:hypothetical protein
MSVLSAGQKREHYIAKYGSKAPPSKLIAEKPLSSLEVEVAVRRIRDELLTARRLRSAFVSCALSIPRYEADFPETAKTLKECARQHRRLWWYAVAAAVRELGDVLAAANDYEPIADDEAGCDLLEEPRVVVAWLVNSGNARKLRRASR